MAVAAHARRRPDHAADQARRGRHRLRRRLRRAGPAVAGAGRGRLSRSRRGDAEQAARPAEQRSGHGRRHQAVAGRARRDRPADRSSRNRTRNRCRSASRRWAAIRSHSCSTFPGCCETFRSSKTPPPGAACSASAPSATASCGACRWSCRRKATIMPSLTFEMLRVATGSSTILIRMDAGRHQGASRCRALKCRPTATASSGCISRRTIRPATSPRSIVLEGRVPADRVSQQARPDRHLGRRPARSEDDAERSVHAGRRGPRPGAGKHPDRRVLSPPNYAVAAELCAAFVLGRRDHRAGADPRRRCAAAVRRRLHRAAGRRRPGICSRNTSC